jgi:hypothetical protein
LVGEVPPILGDATRGLSQAEPDSVFAENGTATVTLPVGSYPLFASGEVQISASYHLPCNLADRDQQNDAARMWDAVVP